MAKPIAIRKMGIEENTASHTRHFHSKSLTDGVTDSAITEFGIKRQKCKSGISYNAFSANPESPIMETVIKESPIITYLAKQESPIMETAIKESPIMSYSTNSESPIMEVQIALFL
jgi:hypothetical protein